MIPAFFNLTIRSGVKLQEVIILVAENMRKAGSIFDSYYVTQAEISFDPYLLCCCDPVVYR